MILDVERFCVNDGPGVRTRVRLKGCPLRCVWCDEPESQLLQPEVEIDGLSHDGSDDCIAACRGRVFASPGQLQDTFCSACPLCSEAAGDHLVQTIGRVWSLSEVMDTLQRDRHIFLRSGGGITLAGGEPLYQSEFTLALLRAAKAQGWHTAIDTSGQASTAVFEEALRWVDLVLFDLKETDLELHRAWTGVPLEPIIRNLVRAAVAQCELWVRLPVVPLANDRDDHWHRLGSLLADLPGKPSAHLVPFHYGPTPVGPGEPRPAAMISPAPGRLLAISQILESYGVDVFRP